MFTDEITRKGERVGKEQKRGDRERYIYISLVKFFVRGGAIATRVQQPTKICPSIAADVVGGERPEFFPVPR